MISSIFSSSVNADYNIKEGAAFRFDISILRTPWDFPYNLHIDDVVFREGEQMVLKFTKVEPTAIEYTFTINGKTGSTPYLTTILIKNCNWEELTQQWEGWGYNVTETDDLWGIRQQGDTIIEADYSKKNGVVKRFYAYNHSDLIDVLNAGEVELIRLTEDSISHNWAYSFLVFIPITGFLIYFIRRKKRLANILE